MTQQQLEREVASVTGESVSEIRRRGFVPLTSVVQERDHEPLMVDWDALELQRYSLRPIPSK